MIFVTPMGRNALPERPGSVPERPRTAQDDPKTAKDGPKTAQDGPKDAQDGQRGAQDGPRGTQDDPKTPQEAPKTPPRRPKRPQKRSTLSGPASGIEKGSKRDRPFAAQASLVGDKRGYKYPLGVVIQRQKSRSRDLTRRWAEGPANLGNLLFWGCPKT